MSRLNICWPSTVLGTVRNIFTTILMVWYPLDTRKTITYFYIGLWTLKQIWGKSLGMYNYYPIRYSGTVFEKTQ